MDGARRKIPDSGDPCDGTAPINVAQQLREFSAEVAELKGATVEAPTETLAHWLAAHYVVAARQLARDAEGEGIEMKTLRTFSADVVALRKGDHSATRLQIERERLEIERLRSEERMQAQFEEWPKQPEIQDRLCGGKLSPEERERRMREIFGLPEKGKGGLSKEAREEIERAMHVL